jgi:ferredoxin
MTAWILAGGWIVFVLLAVGAAGFTSTSIAEQRWRAVVIAIVLFLPLLGVLAAALLIDYAARPWVISAVLAVGVLAALLVTLPIGPNRPLRIVGPQKRVDEREAIFHRFYRLRSGTPEFEQFYRDHPEKRAFDDKLRQMPRLAHPGTRSYDRLSSPFQIATFEVLEGITRDVEWQPAPIDGGLVEASPEEFTRRVKGFARYLGANLVGTTKLNPAYVYSHIGRSPGPWGEPITLNHEFAVAIGVEMKPELIRHAPDGATTTETAFKYFEAAKVAMLLARYINLLGYEARAHIDGNYRVLCGPIAADAGLGELGRLGLIITPRFGPRVRWSTVTTNLPLIQDKPVTFGVQHFCDSCRKCAVNCPSQAIAHGDKAVILGVEKWQSDQESCYRFWRHQGSDCSVCVRVCPYSHPATPLHDLVRWVVRRNSLARHVALWCDDLFYGRHAKTRFRLPDWHAPS